MSNKPSITYIKDGKEQTINNFSKPKFPLKHLLTKSHNEWDLLYETELFREYQTLKKEIELIHLKNYTFTKKVELYCDNPDAIVILENCVFKCDFIGMKQGNYQIINPNFDSNYRNVINAFNCQSIEIKGDENTTISCFDARLINYIKLSCIKKIKSLEVLSDSKITIEKIPKIDEYNINAEEIEIKSCPSTFNLFLEEIDYYHRFLAQTIILKNTNITYQKNNWYFKVMRLENSSINYSNYSKPNNLYFPNLKELILNKSHINSSTSIEIPRIKKIELDDTSYLKVKDDIGIGKHQYKNELNPNNPFTLNKDTLNEIPFIRRILIDYLREISDVYHKKIIEQSHNEEQKIVYELQKEKDKEIKLIEEINDKKITRAKKKIRLKEEENLSNTKIGNIN